MSIGGFLKRVARAIASDLAPRVDTHTTNDDEYWEYEEPSAYDPYQEFMSTDNPFLGYEASGFVYATLLNATIAHWPHVLVAPSLAADSFENAVLGALELFTDNNERAAKGTLFEAGRLIAGQLNMTDDEVLRMAVLGVYDVVDHVLKNDAFVSDGCLYMIQAFLADEFEDLFDSSNNLPSLPDQLATYLTAKHGLDSVIDGYRILTVTVLMIGTRQWITDEFPEFEGVSEDATDE